MAARRRLQTELTAAAKDTLGLFLVRADEANILCLHYCIRLPEEGKGLTSYGVYGGGAYYGTLLFPPEYPFKPPQVKMMTPSGRFAVNTRLCFRFVCFVSRAGRAAPPPALDPR